MAKTHIKAVYAPDKGVDKYLPANLIDDKSWSAVHNVHFTIGGLSKVLGWRKFIPSQEPLGEPILAIDNFFKFDNSSWLLFLTNSRAFYLDETTDSLKLIGSFASGGTDHLIMTENFNDNFIITNGIDYPKYWDGIANQLLNIPGMNDMEGGVTDFKAECVVNFNGFLMFGRTTENGFHCPQRIRWCRLHDMTKWKNDADGNGQAGWADLTDGVDWIQNMKQLGNYLIVYKERSIQVLSYVGGYLIFDKRPAIIGTGLLAPKAIIDLGTEHIFIGPDNIYSFDLMEPKIAGDNIAKEFFRLLNPGKTHLISSFYIEEIPEAVFVFVSIDSPNGLPDKALVYNVDTKAWSIRDLPMTAFGFYNLRDDKTIDSIQEEIDSILWEIDSSTSLANAPINLCADENGIIYILEGNSKDGADLHGWAETKLFDFDRPDILKRVTRIQLAISREGPFNLEVSIGTADNVDEPVNWLPPQYMKLDKTYPPWIDVDVTSRYFCLRFGTRYANEPFKLTGYQIYYQERGIL